MFELDPCGALALGNESDLDLRADRCRLPLAADVPGHDEAAGRLPYDDPADIRLGAVLAELVPPAAEPGFHNSRFHRQLADALVARPPAPKTGGEDLKRIRLARFYANVLAHGCTRDGHGHFLCSSLWFAFWTSAWNAASASSQD